MKVVAIVDTSVLCELLPVPGLDADHEAFTEEFARRARNGERFILPFAAILETGNHVGHVPDGTRRRDTAQKFCHFVRNALDGKTPFETSAPPSKEDVGHWLDEFVEWATQTDPKGKGRGLGDLAIRKLWEEQCKLNPQGRVYIWSGDGHLAGFDSKPPK